MDRRIKDSYRYTIVKLEQMFEDKIPELIEVIMEGYDSLSVKVSDSNSKTNPELFRDQFKEKLDNFTYVYKTLTQTKLVVPDMYNFNFVGIPIVEQILEGTAGTFVEILHEDLVKLTGKSTINEEPVDSSITKQKRVYLIRYDDKVRQAEKGVLKKKLIRFPFSNTPALDATVFGVAEEYVVDNIDKWIDSTLKTSTKEISQKCGKG